MSLLKKEHIQTLLVSVVLFAAVPVAFAWTSAPANPPKNNVEAPVNVSISNQNKLGKLGLGGLAVFGKFQLIDGTEGVGKVLVSDSSGKASWGNVGSGGVVSSTGTTGNRSVVCGGWLNRFNESNSRPPSATTNYLTDPGYSERWGCATESKGVPSCPADYDTINTARLTGNGYEQTWICVISKI